MQSQLRDINNSVHSRDHKKDIYSTGRGATREMKQKVEFFSRWAVVGGRRWCGGKSSSVPEQLSVYNVYHVA